MKEDNGYQGVGATAFDLPNSQHPDYTNKIYYGDQRVPHPINDAAKPAQVGPYLRSMLRAPHPTNSAAKIVDHAKTMRQVLSSK